MSDAPSPGSDWVLWGTEGRVSPAALGYRMPGEWEPHAATWLAWPHNDDTWPNKLDKVQPIWMQMIEALTLGEEVHLLVRNSDEARAVRSLLARARVGRRGAFVHEMATNDAWMRDYGPTFISRQGRDGPELAVVDWRFNAWGGKYPPWDEDAAVARRIAELLAVPRFEPGIVLEGGAIEVNGRGTVLTTEPCLLNPNRNPHLTRNDVEGLLSEYLGVRNVLWLAGGLAGDDTDGHVDNVARFVSPTTVVATVEDDPADDNYEPLRENVARLRHMRDETGNLLHVVLLPMPDPVWSEGRRLPASYANFYIGNEVVLVPTFGQVKDERAMAVVSSLFPDRRVLGIYCADVVAGFGAVHCVTQQQPRSQVVDR